MQHTAIDELLALLPPSIGAFEGSQFPLPVKTTFLGDATPSIEDIREALCRERGQDVKRVIEPVLLGAELVEAARADRQDFFLVDSKVQSLVFMGSKWRSGWALVLGGNRHKEHVELLQARDFMVFTDHPDLDDTIFIGDRPTSPVYFLQLMVRYGLVWGRIRPGDDHAMGHFLETDMPGFLLITENLPALKYLVVLGLMKLGAPAVVPPDYPFPYGNWAVAGNPEEAVTLGSQFPNLRAIFHEHEIIRLPAFCNVAHAQEEFTPATRIGGSEVSFFLLRQIPEPKDLAVEGESIADIGILVEVGHPEVSPDVAATLEKDALKAIDFIHGVRARVNGGILAIELAEGVCFDPAQIGEAIRGGLRLKYPRLDRVGVKIFRNSERLRAEAVEAAREHAERTQFVKNMSEENTDIFGACTECRPFSLDHTCILTPERLPMCASRTYHTVKAAALFGSTVLPHKRRSEQRLPLRSIFPKGAVIDEAAGEYEGVNRVYAEMTGGRIGRVQLHSLRQCPPTSCGCFQNLAFWIESVGGIGIMSRNSQAAAPDGSRWYELANRAGGKQAPGILGVSTSYLRSKHFLKGDGGMANVVWMDRKLKESLQDALPPDARVATETDVTTLDELKAFIERP